jgi:hypothetical protein
VGAKNKLLDLIGIAYKEEVDFVATLNDEDRSATGTSQNWAIKDVLAHSAAWKVMMSERFIAARGNHEPPSYDDLDVLNEELFRRHRKKSWQEVEAFIEQANRQLLEQVRLVDEEVLVDPERYTWLKGRSLWKRTIHNGYFHPMGHVAFLYSERGDKEIGNQLMEEATRILLTLDESAAWQGQSLYNLACFYALSGEKSKALENLSQCFSLNPDIIEWSKQDTDLESLWDDPAYLALVADTSD